MKLENLMELFEISRMGSDLDGQKMAENFLKIPENAQKRASDQGPQKILPFFEG